MLTPEYLLHVSEGAEEIAEELHQEIINRIVERMMQRIGRGDDYILTAVDKWNLEVLQDAGYLLEDIQGEIAAKTGVQEEEIRSAMRDAGIKTLEYDDKIYRAGGLEPLPLEQSQHIIALMQRNYEATAGEWKNFTGTTAEASQQAYIAAMDKAYNLTASGVVGYTQAVKEAINDIVSRGVFVTYPSGHTDTIETATLRAVRTGVSQMSGQITDARMDEMDWDIILVSSHLGARVTGNQDYTDHSWWQGKFYSKSGKDRRFRPFSVCGMGNVQGIHGANCRHSHGPGDGEHNPFEQYDSEENRKQYEIEQRQRAMERRIRKTKREAMGTKTARDNCQDEALKEELDREYQRKAAFLQKQNAAYSEYCKNNNLRPLRDRLTIAKWDRKQAASASGAARKYKNALEISRRQDIIKERISNGEYSLNLSKQQYLKHVDGTKQFDAYMVSREARGHTVQGKLFLTEEEAQDFINRMSGTGVPKTDRNGNVQNVEFVSGDKVIGKYMSGGEWKETRRAAIHYGKRASHIVPVEERHD